jgi:peptide/nickel transport system substrate-binding protein
MVGPISRRTLLKGGVAAVGAATLLSTGGGALGAVAGATDLASRNVLKLNAPKRGGTLRYAAAAGDVASADPATAVHTLPLLVAANCYDTLTVADDNFNIKPGLATEWSSNSSATVWHFTIRSGVTFHNGQTLTAQDAAYSLARTLDPTLASPGLGSLGAYTKPSNITALDAHIVQITLTKPNAFLPVILSSVVFAIVPNGSTTFSNSQDLGTGPFQLTGFGALTYTNMKANPHYWRSGEPYLDAVQVVVIAEDATRIEALQTRSQDFVDNITGSETLLMNSAEAKPFFIPYGGWVGVTCFGNTSPFHNPEVIEAMKYAANRQAIMSVVAPGVNITTADIPVPPTDQFYPAGLKAKDYDPEKARSLLKKAGYGKGLDITMYAYEGDKLDTAVSYKSTAASAGINVKVANVPHATFFSEDFLKKPCIAISVARLHVAQGLPELYFKTGALNMTHFDSAKFEGLVTSATGSTTVARQKTLFGDALEIINNNASNVIPGWEHQEYGMSTSLFGVKASNGGQVYLGGAYFQ